MRVRTLLLLILNGCTARGALRYSRSLRGEAALEGATPAQGVELEVAVMPTYDEWFNGALVFGGSARLTAGSNIAILAVGPEIQYNLYPNADLPGLVIGFSGGLTALELGEAYRRASIGAFGPHARVSGGLCAETDVCDYQLCVSLETGLEYRLRFTPRSEWFWTLGATVQLTNWE